MEVVMTNGTVEGFRPTSGLELGTSAQGEASMNGSSALSACFDGSARYRGVG